MRANHRGGLCEKSVINHWFSRNLISGIKNNSNIFPLLLRMRANHRGGLCETQLLITDFCQCDGGISLIFSTSSSGCGPIIEGDYVKLLQNFGFKAGTKTYHLLGIKVQIQNLFYEIYLFISPTLDNTIIEMYYYWSD